MSPLLLMCRWLATSSPATYIRESDNLFSIIETVHVLGIMFTAGMIAIADLRILGVVLTRYPAAHVLLPLVRLTWMGFGLMSVSGLLLFCSEADKLFVNAAFRLKLILLIAAGLNQWFFQAHHPRSAVASRPDSLHQSARASALLSLIFWIGIIVTGRAIAYL